jgi:hypothetical protein
MAFPPEIVKDVRKACAEGVPVKRRPTTFPGDYGPTPPAVVVAPEFVIVGPGPGGKPPPWCQACGADLSKKPAIEFEYDFYPRDGRSQMIKWWICASECKHMGMGVPK